MFCRRQSQTPAPNAERLGRALIIEVGSRGWSKSALPPKADIRERIQHVCFVPEADIAI